MRFIQDGKDYGRHIGRWRQVSQFHCLGCHGVTDRTRTDRAVGPEIVQAVVDIIRENCIYPNDRVFLRRLAYVQSQDGLDIRTFRPDFFGGIWQVKESEFNSTSSCTGLEHQCKIIEDKLNIVWTDVAWENLTVPLYSGLAASLLLQMRARNNTPGEADKQAEFWVNNYQHGKTKTFYLSEIQKLVSDTCEIDLAFIVDTSGSIGYFNFIDMLGFMKKVTRGLTVGPSNAQIAVVSFSDTARIEFQFGEHEDHTSLEKAINSVNYDAMGTATSEGIKLARESIFKTSSRKGATKVALVITDGSSDSFHDTVKEAKTTREEGIVLFALGIGNINKAELYAIASPPDCTHVITLAGFSEIDNVVQEIKKSACRAPIVVDSNSVVGINGTNVDIHGVRLNVTYKHSIHTTTTLAFVTQKTDSNFTGAHNVLEVKVNCGVVQVYTSFDNPHPSSVFYSQKLTAADGHPALLFLNKTADGRPLYVTSVGTPYDIKGKNCSDANYFSTFAHINISKVDVICREDGIERPCTKKDFELKPDYKNMVCQSNGISVLNPCTTAALQRGEFYHPHPDDDTKFIRCDYQQKMYVIQCPDGQRYTKGSDSCGTAQVAVGGDRVSLDSDLVNPCTPQSLINHQFFFSYPKDNTKYIHCDVWGHAWVSNCSSNMVWSQSKQTCIPDVHTSTNPCTQDKVKQGYTMFPHQDPHKYIHCDNALNPWVQSCTPKTVFNFDSQNCVWETAPVG
ncbi:uncharacterized protein LOC133196851 [Saccostrea echinata]|uniref:uncharacterized protein LOC133196851 n=1 Tax=Saccostrea echinata TaxID=191078 RepID=UPI002A7EFEEF|nr:uncharacterized protein LOC133196851 [Saccostrea echinata]